MPVNGKTEADYRSRDSSPIAMLSGWVQQGTETFFATQRILLDLVMRQNSLTINAVKDALSWKRPAPAHTLTELAGEGMANFIAAQRILLNLAQRENELLMTGVRERIGGSAVITAMADLMRRSVDTFIDMQQHFLSLAARETEAWVDSAKTGEPFQGKGALAVAREAIEQFVRSQKKFLDVLAEQVAKATEGKGEASIETTELTDLAKMASDSFIEAQKKMLDIASNQVDVNLKTARRAVEMIPRAPKIDFAHLTRETVDSYVTAQKALLDVMTRAPKRHDYTPTAEVERPARKKAASRAKKATA
jgi:hypothetical protein